MAANTLAVIDDFLAQKRIVFVGASRDAKSFSRRLFDEFRKRGYDVVPVNPGASEIDGLPCYASVQDIQPPVDAALLMTSRDVTYRAVLDCEQAGIRRVWVYGVSGSNDASAGAVEFCTAHGIDVVAGYCPFMFLPQAGLVHRFHGRVMKFMRTYPVHG